MNLYLLAQTTETAESLLTMAKNNGLATTLVIFVAVWFTVITFYIVRRLLNEKTGIIPCYVDEAKKNHKELSGAYTKLVDVVESSDARLATIQSTADKIEEYNDPKKGKLASTVLIKCVTHQCDALDALAKSMNIVSQMEPHTEAMRRESSRYLLVVEDL